MAYHFKNLVFEGGGVKGVAYIGALRALQERGILDNVARVGGTSAGAINATIMACGYTVEEANDILWGTDFHEFMDDTRGIFRNLHRVLTKYGWHRGEFFRKWIGRVIKAKTGRVGTTFKQLRALAGPDLYMVATNVETKFAEVFSHERTPDMAVRDAVRMSMSFPLFFTAVRHRGKGLYIDGGLFNNYPVKLFDRERYVLPRERRTLARRTEYYERDRKRSRRKTYKPIYNKQTLGLRLDSENEIEMLIGRRRPKGKKINNFYRYTTSLIGSVMNAETNQHLHSDDWQRTVYIDTVGVKTLSFELSDREKKRLVDSGRAGVEGYFEWYDAAARRKATRPIPHPKYVEPTG
ncbi:MAG: patatin-like phospholipase family protein [bacterium]|nr:patatin-like phospholipase family protein [bacterium]